MQAVNQGPKFVTLTLVLPAIKGIENLPNALRSVHVHMIRRWEHRMFRWIEPYRLGLGTRKAQVQVQKISSTRCKSHRCIPEGVAGAFD